MKPVLLENHGVGPRILVVEDHGALGRFIAAVLQDAGCVVIGPIAERNWAMEVARQHPLDLGLVDRRLRDGETFAVVDALVTRGIRCLLISGYARTTLPTRFNDLPFLEKPFTMDGLRDAVDAALAAPPPIPPPHSARGDDDAGPG